MPCFWSQLAGAQLHPQFARRPMGISAWVLCLSLFHARVTVACDRVAPICRSVCLSRVRPASLGRIATRKHVRALLPSQRGSSAVSVPVGSWRCQPADISTVGMHRDQELPPIRPLPPTENTQIYSFKGCLSGELNSITVPARCCDMYRYAQPRAYDRSAGIGVMTTRLK